MAIRDLTSCFEYQPQVFTLIPEKIIVFKSPSSRVPDDSTWMDTDGERHFSALFYADLLAHMGVSLVTTSAREMLLHLRGTVTVGRRLMFGI